MAKARAFARIVAGSWLLLGITVGCRTQSEGEPKSAESSGIHAPGAATRSPSASQNNAGKATYVPWGFKLNLMYLAVPHRYFRNLHNFNEFDAPRVDIGMLTGSLFERAIYDFQTERPRDAQDFYEKRRDDIASETAKLLVKVGAIKEEKELVFKGEENRYFFPPSRVFDKDETAGKKHVFFVAYSSSDSVGSADLLGWSFLRVVVGWMVPANPIPNRYRWYYHEYQVGRGDPKQMSRRFLAGPMFIAHFGEAYTSLDFSDSITKHELFDKHSTYYKVTEKEKEPFEQLIKRETISEWNEYGQFIVCWDGRPAPRSVVASQTYYDFDDDFQSSQIDAILTERIKSLEARIKKLEGK